MTFFWMVRILIVGDPHGKVKKVKEKKIDLVLITGDLGKADLARKFVFENARRRKEGLPELKKDEKYVKDIHTQIHNSTLEVLRYYNKIASVYTLQGNVGIPSISDVKENKRKYGLKLPCTKKILDAMPNVYFVKNRLRNLNGLRVGFLEYFVDNCWIKEFGEKDKKRIRGGKKDTAKAKRVLDRFGSLDILVCHQPPYGVLDKVGKIAPKHWRGKHAGSKVILECIKKYQPRYVFCGHIHEGEGKKKIGKTEVYNLGVAKHILLDID